MHFLAAGSLVSLAVVPLLVLLYFMKLRRPEVQVSASFLWQRALQQARANSFFERLRFNWLLLLQLLAMLAMCVALARPYLPTAQGLAPAAIFVLDGSASMQTREGGRTRFAMACDEIARRCQRGGADTRCMLIEATRRARVIAPLTADRVGFMRALSTLRPHDTGRDLQPALLLAQSIAHAHEAARIYVVTDAPPAETSQTAMAESDIDYVHVGATDVPDAAITAFDARLSSDGYEVFGRVQNFGTTPVAGYLDIYRGGALAAARQVDVPAGASRDYMVPLPRAGAPTLEGRLRPADALEVDNHAWAVLPAATPQRLLLVTRGNPFLENALTLLPSTRVFKISPERYDAATPADVTVWDRLAPATPLHGHHLLLAPPQDTALLTVGLPQKGPWTIDEDARHPLFRYVDLSMVEVARRTPLDVPSWGQVVARADNAQIHNAPLMVVLERPEYKALVIGFDLLDSDFPLAVGFPIFLSNAAAWLGGEGVTQPPSAVSSEEAIGLAFLGRTGPLRVTAPDGHVFEQTVNSLSASFDEADQCGFYDFAMGDRHWKVAVNLPPPAVERTPPGVVGPSGASPQDTAAGSTAAAGSRPAPTPAAPPGVNEYAWVLLALAFMFLAGEWYAYHRGV
jgi:hypothetical protein